MNKFQMKSSGNVSTLSSSFLNPEQRKNVAQLTLAQKASLFEKRREQCYQKFGLQRLFQAQRKILTLQSAPAVIQKHKADSVLSLNAVPKKLKRIGVLRLDNLPGRLNKFSPVRIYAVVIPRSAHSKIKLPDLKSIIKSIKWMSDLKHRASIGHNLFQHALAYGDRHTMRFDTFLHSLNLMGGKRSLKSIFGPIISIFNQPLIFFDHRFAPC